MDRAPVSVVIPTYNRPDLVRDAIDSVLAQTFLPSQIILIDDGSREPTAKRLVPYLDKIVYRYQENGGLSAARNHGIRLATEPFVAFLDDDDVWHPRKIELQMRCLERDPEIGLLGAEQFDWPADEFPEVPPDPSGRLNRVTWEELVIRTLIPVSSVLIRRDLLRRVGDFDVTMRSSEDRDLFLRVAEVAPIAMLRIPLSGYRDTAGSLCKYPDKREQAMRRILRQLDERDAWNGRRLLRHKAYSFMHLGCADAHARAGDHVAAVTRVIKALARYPLPYRGDETRLRFERPKRLAINLLRLCRLRSPDRGPAMKAPAGSDALRKYREGALPLGCRPTA